MPDKQHISLSEPLETAWRAHDRLPCLLRLRLGVMEQNSTTSDSERRRRHHHFELAAGQHTPPQQGGRLFNGTDYQSIHANKRRILAGGEMREKCSAGGFGLGWEGRSWEITSFLWNLRMLPLFLSLVSWTVPAALWSKVCASDSLVEKRDSTSLTDGRRLSTIINFFSS